MQLTLKTPVLGTTMMYYWIVKHDDSDDQDIISYREDLGALRQHHVIVESLSPPLNSASFTLGRRICTEKTWRDLNDALVAYLQSQNISDGKERPGLGINIGTNYPPCPRASDVNPFPDRNTLGIQNCHTTKREVTVIVLQIPRRDILVTIDRFLGRESV